MINLSVRLKTIADYIDPKEDIADIGTDHGYLPLFLFEQNPDRKVVFTDVNEGPLIKARQMISKEHPGADLEKFDVRLGDGLKPIKPGEIDDVVIAGMGGLLIRNILENDITKTHSFKKILMQPRTAADKLRKWLFENDLFIYDEILVYENGKICEIIAVDPRVDKKNHEFKDELDYEFSPIILKKDGQIVNDWIKRLYKVEMQIKISIESSGTASSYKKLNETERRIQKLNSILSTLENDHSIDLK